MIQQLDDSLAGVVGETLHVLELGIHLGPIGIVRHLVNQSNRFDPFQSYLLRYRLARLAECLFQPVHHCSLSNIGFVC